MNAPTSTPRSLVSILCMSAALVCGLVSAAMAAELPEVQLNSGSVQLPAAEARLIRTAMTPSEVTLHLPIGMGETVCTEYAQVPHTGQNGARCGYNRLVRRVCREIPMTCHYDSRLGRQVCSPARRACHNEIIEQARACTWLATECVRTGVAQSTEERKVLLKLKNLERLAAGETEEYDLRGRQNHLNGLDAIFSLASISTKQPVKIKTRDGLLTGFKDVIIIKGE